MSPIGEVLGELLSQILIDGIGSLLRKIYRFFFPLPAKPLPKKRKIRFDIKR
jgi:hypothetical protein